VSTPDAYDDLSDADIPLPPGRKRATSRRGTKRGLTIQGRRRAKRWIFEILRAVTIALVAGGLLYGGYAYLNSSNNWPPRLFPNQQTTQAPEPNPNYSTTSPDKNPGTEDKEKKKKDKKKNNEKNKQ